MTKVKAIRQFPLINQTGHGRGGRVELLSSDKMSLPGRPLTQLLRISAEVLLGPLSFLNEYIITRFPLQINGLINCRLSHGDALPGTELLI